MRSEPTENVLALWNEYLKALNHYHEATENLLRACRLPDKRRALVEILRHELEDVGNRFQMLEVVERLATEDQQILIEELLPLAAMLETKRSFNGAEKIVLSWPREWLEANLEKPARRVLERVAKGEFEYIGLSEYYSGLIGIYRHVALGKAKQFAEEAAAHRDREVRAVGESWLNDDWV